MKRTQSRIVIVDSHAEVELTKGTWAKIDLEDIDEVSKHVWCNSQGYAFSNKLRLRLHQFLLGPPPESMIIDHENRIPLDCRRLNIHFVTRKDNAENSTRSDNGGVNQIKKTGRWRARLGQKQLGMFATEEEATKAVHLAKYGWY